MARCLDLAAGAAIGAALISFARGDETPPAAPEAVAETPAPPSVRATALAVIDGDTFEARVAVFPGQEIVTRVRIAGVDAPERNGRCPQETRAAEEATRALEELVAGRSLTLAHVRGDKYFGRVLADVSTSDDGDVAATLIAMGHGRAYAGGRREGWC